MDWIAFIGGMALGGFLGVMLMAAIQINKGD